MKKKKLDGQIGKYLDMFLFICDDFFSLAIITASQKFAWSTLYF